MANCPTCGATMAHFENPPRDICPNEPHPRQPTSGGGTVRPGVRRDPRMARPKKK